MLPKQDGELFPTVVSCSGKTVGGKPLDTAIDRDLVTVVAALPALSSQDIWMRFELPKLSFVDKIVIYTVFWNDYYVKGPCHDKIDKYKGCKRAQNGTEVSVYQGEVKRKSCGTLYTTEEVEQTDQIYTIYCQVKGIAVVLSTIKDYNTFKLPVWEILIFGKHLPGLYIIVTFNDKLFYHLIFFRNDRIL